jgi:hypothetical protein
MTTPRSPAMPPAGWAAVERWADRHPRLMDAGLAVLAVVSTIVLLLSSRAPVVLYQTF